MWTDISYILGSIIGTGIFTLISTTAGRSFVEVMISFGFSSIVFLGLGYLFGKTDNPFKDIEEIMFKKLGVVIGILYWILSWSSTILIIYELCQEIMALCGIGVTRIKIIIIQLIITIGFMMLQRFGISRVNKVEVVTTGLKVLMVSVIPIILIWKGLRGGYQVVGEVNYGSALQLVPQMMWMYLGIESCSLIRGNDNARSITKTVVTSILIIFAVYSLNILGVMSCMNDCVNLSSPYPSLVANAVGLKGVRTFMSFVTIILLSGSTNSWYVMSAKTFQSLDNIFPTKYTSNYFYSVIFSSIGLIFLSIIVSNPDVKFVFSNLLDIFSIISSLFYFSSAFSITKKYKLYAVGVPISLSFASFLAYMTYKLGCIIVACFK